MEPAPQPPGPSEPEAPVVPAAHEADATESVPEPEGPEERPAGTENPPTEPGGRIRRTIRGVSSRTSPRDPRSLVGSRGSHCPITWAARTSSTK